MFNNLSRNRRSILGSLLATKRIDQVYPWKFSLRFDVFSLFLSSLQKSIFCKRIYQLFIHS